MAPEEQESFEKTQFETNPRPPEGLSNAERDCLHRFKELPLAGSVHEFFDRLEQWGLPVIACFGTSRSGKSSLIENFPSHKETARRDRLSGVTRQFVKQRDLSEIGLASAPLAHIEFHYPPTLCWAKHEELVDLDGAPPERQKALFAPWWDSVSAVFIMLEHLYQTLRVTDLGIDREANKTTQFLIAHRCAFDRAPDLEFILLDVPGELLAAERQEVAAVALERLPRIVNAAVFVESFSTLYVESPDLRFRMGEKDLDPKELQWQVFGVPPTRTSDFRNASDWWNAYGRTGNRFATIPTPLLSIITKFDFLEDQRVFEIEYKGHDARIHRAVSAFQQRKDEFVNMLEQPETDLNAFGTKFHALLQAARNMVQFLGGNESILLWSALLDALNEEKHFLIHSRFLSHVPVQCHAIRNGRSERCAHGVALVRWWIFDRLISWYDAMGGRLG